MSQQIKSLPGLLSGKAFYLFVHFVLFRIIGPDNRLFRSFGYYPVITYR